MKLLKLSVAIVIAMSLVFVIYPKANKVYANDIWPPGPERGIFLSTWCVDENGNAVAAGNFCLVGFGTCIPNNCPPGTTPPQE